jgi:hypothetical protein
MANVDMSCLLCKPSSLFPATTPGSERTRDDPDPIVECAKRSHRHVRCPEMSAFVRMEMNVQNEATARSRGGDRDPGRRSTSAAWTASITDAIVQNEATGVSAYPCPEMAPFVRSE